MHFLNILGYSNLSTGPARNTLAFHRFIQETSDSSTLIINRNKAPKQSENGSGDNPNGSDDSIIYANLFKSSELIKTQIKKSDVVVFHAIPFPFSDDIKFTSEDKQVFIDLLDFVKSDGKPVVYYEYAHEATCIRRYNFLTEPGYQQNFQKFDLTVTYHPTNGIGELYQQYGFSDSRFVNIGRNDLPNIISLDLEDLKTKFWKPFSEKNPKTIHNLGRSCTYKGTWLFRDLHWSHFKDAGFISKCEGLIYGIGNLKKIYSKYTTPKIPREDVFLVPQRVSELQQFYDPNYEFKQNMPIYMFPKYDHNDGLERLSRSQFGFFVLLFKDRYLPETFENTMLETVAVGTVPIFRKRWAQMFKVNNKSLFEYGSEHTGMVFLDEHNPNPAIAQMEQIGSNKDLYDKYRENCFRFVNQNLGFKKIYGKVLEKIKIALETKTVSIWDL